MDSHLKWALLALTPFFAFTLACQNGLTLPPEGDDVARGPAKIGTIPLRERRNILPGNISGPPPPEPGIYPGQCDDLENGGPLKGRDCITGRLRCGDTIVGHTAGGVNRYNTRFYERNFCTPALTDHDGGDERIYELHMPEGDRTALVTLDSPCADLDMAAMLWNGNECPSGDANISRCEMWPKPAGAREQVRLVTQKETTWLIAVEGKGDEEGAFSLSVQCWKGLM